MQSDYQFVILSINQWPDTDDVTCLSLHTMSFRIQLEDCSHDSKRQGMTEDQFTEYGDAATTVHSGVASDPDGSGPSPQLSPSHAERRPLRVEFIGMDEMDSSNTLERHDVEKDFKRVHGGGKGTNSLRYKQARMSLLGKPLNYRAHKRDIRYRRFQAKVYNFLERPKDWKAISYHLLVWVLFILYSVQQFPATIPSGVVIQKMYLMFKLHICECQVHLDLLCKFQG